MLTVAARACTGLTLAPMINRGRYRLFANRQTEYSTRAIDLVHRSLVVDMLSPFKLGATTWFSDPSTFTARDLQRFKDSGINVFHIGVGFGSTNQFAVSESFLAQWNAFLIAHTRSFVRVDSRAALDQVKASGRIGVILGLQNSEHFRTLDDVDAFYKAGQRVSQLTYNTHNAIGDGSAVATDAGVSAYGRTVIERMNTLGMAVDVSHCGDKTTLDAFEVSKKPVLITHANCRALTAGHPRCKTDEAIRKMAASGGVMGITGVRHFVSNVEPTTIEHMLDHYDHVRKLVGVEHLGVGSDIDLDCYDDMTPQEIARLKSGATRTYSFRDKLDISGADHPKRMFDLAEGLIRRKYNDADVEGVLGGNFRRVLKAIWGS
jgi:membrane dipeptidase